MVHGISVSVSLKMDCLNDVMEVKSVVDAGDVLVAYNRCVNSHFHNKKNRSKKVLPIFR